jgi:hypothetical protein
MYDTALKRRLQNQVHFSHDLVFGIFAVVSDKRTSACLKFRSLLYSNTSTIAAKRTASCALYLHEYILNGVFHAFAIAWTHVSLDNLGISAPGHQHDTSWWYNHAVR